MKSLSATTRVTLGLLCLAVSVWLSAYMLGLFPDVSTERLAGRVKLSENVALTCSLLASRNDLRTMATVLEGIRTRNRDVASAGVRRNDNELLIEAGPHQADWTLPPGVPSTPSQMRVPILAGDRPWGTVELRFVEPPSTARMGWLTNHPLFSLGMFSSAAMYLLFFVYLRNMLRHLDPTRVIPRRVRQTLDNMAGGLLVLDRDERILLANQAFAESIGERVDDLTGKLASELPFQLGEAEMAIESYPWRRVLQEGEGQASGFMVVRVRSGPLREMKVSAVPVFGDDGNLRGAMVSFDDITQIRAQQAALREMLQELGQQREEVQRQNAELERLAARDALTGCLNRRAFFREFEKHWSASERHHYPLSCLMVDLDHFKRINDTYGHQSGDQVLQRTAELLRNGRRPTDMVCRYGGEEFCILLPHTGLEAACVVAEQIRRAIETADFDGVPVTSSVGVAARDFGARDPNELIDQADKCLYVAKRNGRNCVIRFDAAQQQIAEFEAAVSHQAPEPPAERTEEREQEPGIPFNAVMALVSALAYRDQMTADHSRRVADLCVAVARRLMSATDSYVLEIAALLHDIGKIGVPDAILLKPGKLTQEEWQVMHSQERIGVEIVKSSFSSPALSEVIRTYRAWFGGNPRHPELPRGQDIPLAARILAIADAYDSITNRNAYREALTRDEAFAELRRCKIRQFDPDLVERFIEVITEKISHEVAAGGDVSKAAALSLGTQIEGLTNALDNLDLGGIASLAQRLSMTAVRYDSADIARVATRLETAARGDTEVEVLVRLTNELVHLCRAAQRAYLNEAVGAAGSTAQATPAGRTQAEDVVQN
ncbi:MAG: diguanylate cyclase [Pirellulales bacterium]